MIKYPAKLNKGDTIGITATSSPANVYKLDIAEKVIKDLGYNFVETKSIRNEIYKHVGADEKTRANEFLELWKDDKVKYIIEARGGEFLMEALPYIHDAFQNEKLYEKVKWVQGYSDVTTILFYLTTWYNIATIEAWNVGRLATRPLQKQTKLILDVLENMEEFTQESFEKYESGEIEPDENFLPVFDKPSIIKSLDNKDARFEGVLIGGCLDIIHNYVGSKWDNVEKFVEQYKDKGIIWHIENCDMNATDIYRALWFMKQKGWFKYVKGFIVGRTPTGNAVEDFTYLDALENGIGDLNVPVIYDLDIGHIEPQWTIINGSYGIVEYENGKCKLTQKLI